MGITKKKKKIVEFRSRATKREIVIIEQAQLGIGVGVQL